MSERHYEFAVFVDGVKEASVMSANQGAALKEVCRYADQYDDDKAAISIRERRNKRWVVIG